MRATQFQWLRGALRTVALLGAAVSLLGGCAAIGSVRVFAPFDKPVGYVAVATLISALWLPKSIPQSPEAIRPWKRFTYAFVFCTWVLLSILYFVVAPDSGVSLSSPPFHSLFSFWIVSGRMYDSIRSVRSYSIALFGFAMTIAALDPPSPGRVDTGEPPRRLWLLSKRGLWFIIAPPVSLIIVGRLALALKLTSQDTAVIITVIGGLWFILALLVLGIALIVSGASSNPKTDESGR